VHLFPGKVWDGKGRKRLYEVMAAREAIYAKPEFSEEDGELSAELETEFAGMNGYEAECGLIISLSFFRTG